MVYIPFIVVTNKEACGLGTSGKFAAVSRACKLGKTVDKHGQPPGIARDKPG
jgi:hypothetical protein